MRRNQGLYPWSTDNLVSYRLAKERVMIQAQANKGLQYEPAEHPRHDILAICMNVVSQAPEVQKIVKRIPEVDH